jgi:hypothetical protein
MMSDHIMTPRMAGQGPPRQEKDPVTGKFKWGESQLTGARELPKPHQGERSAWMIGHVKDDLAYFARIEETKAHGSTLPNPNKEFTQRTNERTRFTKAERFQSMTKQYVSKGHNQANLCTEGPGPKYASKVTHLDLKTHIRPAWGFGVPTQFNGTRASFLKGKVKDGYMYRAIPATSEKSADVAPTNYQPNRHLSITKRRSVNHVFGNAARFGPEKKIFQGKKFARAIVGIATPGPAYAPLNGTIARYTKKNSTATPAGKWCP